jgi:hypothetical protein
MNPPARSAQALRMSFDFSFRYAKACATSDKLPTVIPSAATAQPWRSRGTLAIVSRENEKSWLNRALRHPWPRCNGAIWFDFAPLRSAALTMTEGHSPPGHRAHHDGVTSQIVLPAGNISLPWRSRGTLAIVSRENEKSWLNRALRHPWPRCNGAIWFDFAPLRSAALTMTEGHSPPGHRAHHDGVTSQIVLPAGNITCSG